jgi:hypothetical protein
MPTETNVAQGSGTVSVTIPANPYRMLVCRSGGSATTPGDEPSLSSCVLDPTGLNIPFTRLGGHYRVVSLSKTLSEMWYLLDPPPGTYNCVATPTDAGTSVGQYYSTLINVDTANPFRSAIAGADASSDAPSVNASSMPTDLVLDLLYFHTVTTLTVGAGQTLTGTEQHLTAGKIKASYESGAAPTVTMSWSSSAANDWTLSAVSVIHKSDTRVRIVKYHTCIWDPERRIVDQVGGFVKPWRVKPDNFCHFQGRETPTATEYSNLNDNPAIEYIEEVGWKSGVSIPTMRGNRNQLPDVRIANLTKRGTL